MDISKILADIKATPGFAENVGMILAHNGVVRGFSRADRKTVKAVEIKADQEAIARLVEEFSQKPGIFKITVEARSGTFYPGDDVMYIAVAGDIREHVKPVLADLLDQVKIQALTKKEIF